MSAHSFFGIYLNLYDKSNLFDLGLHLFGTYAFSLFLYNIFEQIYPDIKGHKFYLTLFIILLGISLGTIFEIFEFLIDLVVKNSSKKQPGLIDTNLDLIFDVFGASLAGLHRYWSQ